MGPSPISNNGNLIYLTIGGSWNFFLQGKTVHKWYIFGHPAKSVSSVHQTFPSLPTHVSISLTPLTSFSTNIFCGLSHDIMSLRMSSWVCACHHESAHVTCAFACHVYCGSCHMCPALPTPVTIAHGCLVCPRMSHVPTDVTCAHGCLVCPRMSHVPTYVTCAHGCLVCPSMSHMPSHIPFVSFQIFLHG